jgi:flavin-dependent dehydrogenase
MKRFFDVAVAGAGPAGAVTALCLARRGVRVALFEATDLNNDRYGETLPPEINPLLRELGLWDAFSALHSLEAPGIISRWGSGPPTAQDFISNAHGCGWHIDRNHFDSMLCREAERAGATLFRQRTLRPGEIQAALLVDASGRAGMRLDESHDYERDDMLLAIALRLSGAKWPDTRTIIETTPQGWWYTSPLPQGNTMAMFFTDPDVYACEGIAIGEQLETAPLTCARLAPARILSSRVVRVASACRVRMYGDRWLAVGDSASAYDPISGRGIFKALRHGAAAADAILNGAQADYAARVRREFCEYARQRRMYYASERSWPESVFWSRRLNQA